jgi:hypothetical protein
MREATLFRDFFPRSLTQWLGPLIAFGALIMATAGFVIAAGVIDLSASTAQRAH